MKQGALLEVLETVLVVTVITALIWLYAEGETIRPETRTIKVRLLAPTPGLAVSVPGQVSSKPGEVEVSVEATILASRGNWPRIADWIRQFVDIEVNDPGTMLSHEQTINLREALNQSALADVNAFVKETEPANVTVHVQQLQEVPMGIKIEPGDLELSNEANEAPLAEPQTVAVTMPADLAEVVREKKLKLIASLDQLDPNMLGEDTAQNVSVTLDLPPELQDRPFVIPAEEQVQVKFIVRKQTEQIDVPGVQVRLLISDDITSRFAPILIDEDQRFIKVTVSGPSEAIQRIKDDDNLVRASILLKLADLNNPDNHSAPLEITVPEGVKVVAKEPNLDTITYTATPSTE